MHRARQGPTSCASSADRPALLRPKRQLGCVRVNPTTQEGMRLGSTSGNSSHALGLTPPRTGARTATLYLQNCKMRRIQNPESESAVAQNLGAISRHAAVACFAEVRPACKARQKSRIQNPESRIRIAPGWALHGRYTLGSALQIPGSERVINESRSVHRVTPLGQNFSRAGPLKILRAEIWRLWNLLAEF